MKSFDDLRAEHPTSGFAIYAYEPGGAVTLEVIDSDGKIYALTRPTLAEVLRTLYPPDPPPRSAAELLS